MRRARARVRECADGLRAFTFGGFDGQTTADLWGLSFLVRLRRGGGGGARGAAAAVAASGGGSPQSSHAFDSESDRRLPEAATALMANMEGTLVRAQRPYRCTRVAGAVRRGAAEAEAARRRRGQVEETPTAAEAAKLIVFQISIHAPLVSFAPRQSCSLARAPPPRLPLTLPRRELGRRSPPPPPASSRRGVSVTLWWRRLQLPPSGRRRRLRLPDSGELGEASAAGAVRQPISPTASFTRPWVVVRPARAPPSTSHARHRRR